MAHAASPIGRRVRSRGQHLIAQTGAVWTTCSDRPVSGVSDLHGSRTGARRCPEQTQVLINEQLVVDLYSR
jgi:hypothetical protein